MDVKNIKALRSLVKLILEDPRPYSWSLQGFGMLRLYLPDDTRLHIWDDRYQVDNVSLIHDHLQWGLTSTILSGAITNQRYEQHFCEVAGSKPYHGAQFIAGFDAKQLHDAEISYLRKKQYEVYFVGDTYSQEPYEIHETEARRGTVTIMQKTPTQDGETARIFWPAGTEWVSAIPRVAKPQEVKDICSYALEQLKKEDAHGESLWARRGEL